MRRNVGRHANRDTNRSVDQQVWEPGGQNGWLLGSAVVVVLEINGFFVDVPHHFHCQRCHLALGVTGGSGRVITRGTEVSLAPDQWVAQVPVLNQTNQGVINRSVAVRVELTHDIANHARALGELLIGSVTTVIHRVEHPAVNWLQAVSNVR